MKPSLDGVRITWLGHATFRLDIDDKVFLIDPWVMNNPKTPADKKKFDKIDVMLCTHGHGDHIGDAVELAKKHQPTVVGIYELCMYMKRKGAENVSPMNKGGSTSMADVRITMVHADHSCGIEDDGQIIYGGEACGFVLETARGLKIYHAGDTNVFGDMHIIHELYAPDIAMIPIGDVFTMGPDEAAYACKLLKPKVVIPMHFGTFPLLTGTADELRHRVGDLGIDVVEMRPGQTLDKL
jgi:L-ascorbate metabolism protein UlaG (beta-lactamase superfamily)